MPPMERPNTVLPPFRLSKWRGLLIGLLAVGAISACQETATTETTVPIIRYEASSSDGSYLRSALVAHFQGLSYPLIKEQDDLCFDSVLVADFNGDGFADFLAEIVNGCGGNCCGNSFVIFSFDGNLFQQTEKVGYDWDGAELETRNGTLSVTVETDNLGMNLNPPEYRKETFQLKNFDWELIQRYEPQKTPALEELRSDQFEGVSPDSPQQLVFDLNNDQLPDSITVTLWERWGILQGELMISGTRTSQALSGKRIGVLPTQTNGFYELVLNINDTLQWDGKVYREIDR